MNVFTLDKVEYHTICQRQDNICFIRLFYLFRHKKRVFSQREAFLIYPSTTAYWMLDRMIAPSTTYLITVTERVTKESLDSEVTTSWLIVTATETPFLHRFLHPSYFQLYPPLPSTRTMIHGLPRVSLLQKWTIVILNSYKSSDLPPFHQPNSHKANMIS